MPSTTLHAGAVDSLGINGVALACPGAAVGFRAVPLFPAHGRLDGAPLFAVLRRFGPFAPDDTWRQFGFDVPVTRPAVNRFLAREHYDQNQTLVATFEPDECARLTLTWGFDGQTAYGRLEATGPLPVLLIANGCIAPAAVDALATDGATLSQGDFTVALRWSRAAERVVAADTDDLLETRARGLVDDGGSAGQPLAGHLVTLDVDTPLHFCLAPTPTPVDPDAVDAALDRARQGMSAHLMASEGAARHCAEAIQRIVGFMTAYDPGTGLRAVPVNRKWAAPHRQPAVFCWDNFFDSFFAALYHPVLARESLQHILRVFADRGIAGAPPQRNLVVPVVYSKLVRWIGDRDFAAAGFDQLLDFVRFWFSPNPEGHPWRDGNDDGLIECGSCLRPGEAPLGRIVQNAMDETGYDDSPMYSDGFGYQRQGLPARGIEYLWDRGTFNLTMVGQNALYVAACRALGVVADWLEREADAAWLAAEAERVTHRIRERLYAPEHGYFLNRFFDGHFSDVETMTIFYPLLAGIADDSVKKRLRQRLLDPAHFGGEQVIPTVSRNDPAFGRQPGWDEAWAGNYWRGYIWPPTNYITWLAIRNAPWPDLAADFAAKSRRLFLADWLEHGFIMENYPADGRTPDDRVFFGQGGRCPHYAWGSCLPLMSLEELFGVEDVAAGIRFGTLEDEAFGAWHNFVYHGHRGSVSCTAAGLELDLGPELQCTADAPVAIRCWRLEDGRLRADYRADVEVRLRGRCGQRHFVLHLPAGTGSIDHQLEDTTA